MKGSQRNRVTKAKCKLPLKKEVEVEILVASLEMNLASDKGETGYQLQKKLLDVLNEGLLDLGLAAGIGGAEKVEMIATVFKTWTARFESEGGRVAEKLF